MTELLFYHLQHQPLEKVLPAHAAKFPGLMANYQPAAAKMQELAQDYGIVVTFMPAGPLLEYNPAKVKQVPTTPQELLAWCKANPNRLIYARPANSGPGRTFVMGLPYLLGDKDPKNPATWDKTWAYLKELNSCIEYYPSGTGAVMKELGEGSRDMTVTMTGWDLNPRILGIVMVVSALGYLADSFTAFLAPQYSGTLAVVVVVAALIGELPLLVWLLLKGVHVQRWHQRARGAGSW